MVKLGILISGGGSNLQAIIDAVGGGEIPDAEILFVFSNNRGAYGLERAKRAGIPTVSFGAGEFENRAGFEKALKEVIDSYRPDFLVLAGCLVTLPKELVREYPRRIINIHPSLIPSFCGVGYYGLHVHRAALERGVKISGATVHYVDEGVDTGEIILQKAVEVKEGDTPESLQKRIMEEAEHVLLPLALRRIAEEFRMKKAYKEREES